MRIQTWAHLSLAPHPTLSTPPKNCFVSFHKVFPRFEVKLRCILIKINSLLKWSRIFYAWRQLLFHSGRKPHTFISHIDPIRGQMAPQWLRIAAVNKGRRVILCIGNIKNECRDRDWHTWKHISLKLESLSRFMKLIHENKWINVAETGESFKIKI